MQWLTAVLAFATAMLFYAIVTSTLVEMIHRFLGLRERGLRLMLESLYTRAIAPRLKGAAHPEITAAQFADVIMANRALAGDKAAPSKKLAPKEAAEEKPKTVSRFFRYLFSAGEMTSIPVELFTQKLADSRIIDLADASVASFVQEFSQKYVAFGTEASEYFRRRARFLSVVVAFFVAMFFYVHPYELAQAFIRDPALAKEVAAYQVKLAIEGEKPGSGNGGASRPEGAATGQTPAAPAADTPAAEEKSDKQELAELKAKYGELQRSIKEWNALNIPVGWPDSKSLKACPAVESVPTLFAGGCTRTWWIGGGSFTVPTASQIFWLLVGGLLVGLGAPFWAQAVGALSASRNASNKIADIVGFDDVIGPAPLKVGPAGLAVDAFPVVVKPAALRTFEVAQKAG